jgi:hypothetical protein
VVYSDELVGSAVDILMETDFSLRVLHIAGLNNDVADALSRADLMRALHVNPRLSIRNFEPYLRVDHHQSPPTLQPPRRTLGVAKC